MHERVDLYDQFILSRRARAVPEDFLRHENESWILATSPSLPVIPVIASNGRNVGWLLGWAVDLSGALLHEQGCFLVNDLGNVEEKRLDMFAGRWACIVLGEQPRCYLDPAGSLAAIYSSADRTLASTTTLLRYDLPRTFSAKRYEERTLQSNQFFPAGLTSDLAAHRLLPNHYLDLKSWKLVRHWPTTPLQRVVPGDIDSIDSLIGTIANATINVIQAFAQKHKLLLPLTAGRDSRMIMAAARPVIDRCEFVTFHYPDHRYTDVTYARPIAKRFQLHHHVIPLAPINDNASMRYLQRVGYDANEGKARDFDVAARQLPLDRGWLTGFAGEVGRSYYWPSRGLTALTGEALLERMHLPLTKPGKRAMDRWVNSVPHQDQYELLDLMYIEQRLGCWASPQLYGTAPFSFNVIPLNQRAVFEAMLSLPLEYRQKQRMASDVVRFAWPELADLPFGRPPRFRGSGELARKILRKVHWHARALLLGSVSF